MNVVPDRIRRLARQLDAGDERVAHVAGLKRQVTSNWFCRNVSVLLTVISLRLTLMALSGVDSVTRRRHLALR